MFRGSARTNELKALEKRKSITIQDCKGTLTEQNLSILKAQNFRIKKSIPQESSHH